MVSNKRRSWPSESQGAPAGISQLYKWCHSHIRLFQDSSKGLIRVKANSYEPHLLKM